MEIKLLELKFAIVPTSHYYHLGKTWDGFQKQRSRTGRGQFHWQSSLEIPSRQHPSSWQFGQNITETNSFRQKIHVCDLNSYLILHCVWVWLNIFVECLNFECCIERTRCFVYISQNIETELSFSKSWDRANFLNKLRPRKLSQKNLRMS